MELFVYAGSNRTYLEKYMDLPVTSRIVFFSGGPFDGKGLLSLH